MHSPTGEGVGEGVETTESDVAEVVCVDWAAVEVTAVQQRQPLAVVHSNTKRTNNVTRIQNIPVNDLSLSYHWLHVGKGVNIEAVATNCSGVALTIHTHAQVFRTHYQLAMNNLILCIIIMRTVTILT